MALNTEPVRRDIHIPVPRVTNWVELNKYINELEYALKRLLRGSLNVEGSLNVNGSVTFDGLDPNKGLMTDDDAQLISVDVTSDPIFDSLRLVEKLFLYEKSTPADPPDASCVIWLNDSGALRIKITSSESVTTTGTITVVND